MDIVYISPDNNIWHIREKDKVRLRYVGPVCGYTDWIKRQVLIDKNLKLRKKLHTYTHEFIHIAGTEINNKQLFGEDINEPMIDEMADYICHFLSVSSFKYSHGIDLLRQTIKYVVNKQINNKTLKSFKDLEKFILIYESLILLLLHRFPSL